ncbi:hypothetical protein [Aliikangiella sp. IMCC44359]|uniref:hypothetical protein n=1 Tax=Aliikangiella sp. IMCC44359 TaxID=3459125 RepID=UPI00403B1CA2
MNTAKYVELLNDILESMHQQSMDNNSAISLSDMSMESYVKMNVKTENSVLIDIELSESGIDIGIDKSPEAFSWGVEHIDRDKKDVISILRIILTSFVEIKSYGKKYKVITFKNSDGENLYSKMLLGGLFSNVLSRKTVVYEPVFSRNQKQTPYN